MFPIDKRSPEISVKDNSMYQKILFSLTSTLLFLFIVLIIIATIPEGILSQVKYNSEDWIQGHVTSLSKNSISIDNIRYQLDILLTIKDFDGNILEPVALRNAEIVKALKRNGRIIKIIIVQFRK
ncbi:MAG: hypothetical protein HXY47_02330 [Nitrospirae bacterium]|nr:hypothetical protein [Nitrospirota bacterium]